MKYLPSITICKAVVIVLTQFEAHDAFEDNFGIPIFRTFRVHLKVRVFRKKSCKDGTVLGSVVMRCQKRLRESKLKRQSKRCLEKF